MDVYEDSENDYDDDDDVDYEDEEDSKSPQYGDDTTSNNNTAGIPIVNRRHNSRSISGTSKLTKSFSTQQNSSKRRQLNINQLCVGKSIRKIGCILACFQKLINS